MKNDREARGIEHFISRGPPYVIIFYDCESIFNDNRIVLQFHGISLFPQKSGFKLKENFSA